MSPIALIRNVGLWPALTFVLAVLLLAQGWALKSTQRRATQLEERNAVAAFKNHTIETEYRRAIQRRDEESKAAIDLARADADRASAVAVGLRRDLAGFVQAHRHRATVAATAPQRQTSSNADVVLADLFSRADDAAGELAAALDQAHARGVGCEASYDAVVAAQ